MRESVSTESRTMQRHQRPGRSVFTHRRLAGGGIFVKETPSMAKPQLILSVLFMSIIGMISPSRAADFNTRCQAPGVVRCFGFDSQAETAPYLASGDSTPVVDTTIMASGTGSLKMTVPPNSGANTSGDFSMNFTPGSLNYSKTNLYPIQFGSGEEFYVQWRQRFSPEFLAAHYAGGGGWKQAIIGEGDRTGVPAYSCTDIHLVTHNNYYRGFPSMYHSCGVKDGAYESLEIYDPATGDYLLQNAVNCRRSLVNSGSPYIPPCVGYKTNQWMTFQIHVKIGTWYKNDQIYHRDSTVQLWVAEDGKASQLVIDRSPESGTGYDLVNLDPTNIKYGKVWLLPYNTGKDSSQTYPTAYTWYDELIVSKSKIQDPSASGDTQPPAPPTGLRVN